MRTGTFAQATTDTAIEKLPFFVYGTLLRGFGNYRWALDGNTDNIIEAEITGFEMYSAGGFPYAVQVEDETKKIQGELMFVQEDKFASVLRGLDRLEGYPNHYDRIETVAVTKDGEEREIQCRVYVYARKSDMRGLYKVESGSWREYTNRPLVAEVAHNEDL